MVQLLTKEGGSFPADVMKTFNELKIPVNTSISQKVKIFISLIYRILFINLLNNQLSKEVEDAMKKGDSRDNNKRKLRNL